MIIKTCKELIKKVNTHSYNTKKTEHNGEDIIFYQCPITYQWHPNITLAKKSYFSKLTAKYFHIFQKHAT